jgi:biotin carboxyl carrier protein
MKRLRVRVNDEWYSIEVGDVYQSPVEVLVDGVPYLVELGSALAGDLPPRRARQQTKQALPGLRGIVKDDDRVVRCPLPGKVVSVSVIKGQTVEPGDEICLLESMKMEQSVRMAQVGIIKNIKIKKNQSVNAGAPLIELQ